MNLLERNADALELKSPCHGEIFCARPRKSVSVETYQATFWTGCPLELENRGAWLETGTTLCLVGNTTAREATVLVQQQEIDLIRPGQPVMFRLADHPRGQISGRVIVVASSPVQDIADELVNDEFANLARIESAAQPQYLVRVRLDGDADPLPIRSTGRARIYVESASIVSRIGKFLADTFG